MALDPESTAKWTGLLTAIGTILALVYRFINKYVRVDRQEAAVAEADISIYQKLQDEITRLEKLVSKLSGRITELENQLTTLKNLEIEAAQDFGALSAIVQNMPCNTCSMPGTAISQLKGVVDRMTARRELKKLVFAAGGENVND